MAVEFIRQLHRESLEKAWNARPAKAPRDPMPRRRQGVLSRIDSALAQLADGETSPRRGLYQRRDNFNGVRVQLKCGQRALKIDGRDHWFDGFSWGFLSVNQPKFKTGAWGATGPDGLNTQVSRNAGGLPGTLVDPCELGDFGAFIYRSLGFQVGNSAYNVPLVSGMASPVDATNNASALMTYFGLV